MLKIAICDDESYMLDNLKIKINEYLHKSKINMQISCFTSGVALLCAPESFDIIIMDILMAGLDGMDTVRRLRTRGGNGQVIFVTASKDHVFGAFDVDAVHYLVKPVSDKDLFHALDKAVRRCKQVDNQTITITKGSSMRLIPLCEILYCEAINHKIYICTTTEKVDCYNKLDALQDQLDNRFFRCHRSYIVNMNFVSGKEEGIAIMANGDKILVSRRRQQLFLQRLLSVIRSEVL